MILSRRVNDDDHRDGFTKWPFMTTHTWGEYPQGTWMLEVNIARIVYIQFYYSSYFTRYESAVRFERLGSFQVKFNAETPQRGWLKEWTLMLHGTREPPYTGLSAADPHSKLAIVKKAHEERSGAY